MTTPKGAIGPLIDWRAKGMPALDRPLPIDLAGSQGWDVLDGRFLLPTMVVRRTALEHNIALLAEYCRTHGVSLAPHGKTTMAPGIFRRQLAAGAWAISVATVWQARVAAANGVERILIANEVVDDAGLGWLAAVLAAGSPEVYCYVDSPTGVERLAQVLDAAATPLPVLIEVGIAGGRAGVRSAAEAIQVAAAIETTGSLRLAGVAFFEGIVTTGSPEQATAAVTALTSRVRALVTELDALGQWASSDEVLVSGGGSQFVDLVVRELARSWHLSRPVRLVVRTGCYVTDDDGSCDATSPFGAHAPGGAPRLEPALEVWAPVLSVPEPGLAIVGAGKRDLAYDDRMPVIRRVRRVSGSTIEPAANTLVTHLNDQHAYVSLGAESALRVGDLVAMGISHPCTAFDKWRFVPLVEDDYRVTEVLEVVF